MEQSLRIGILKQYFFFFFSAKFSVFLVNLKSHDRLHFFLSSNYPNLWSMKSRKEFYLAWLCWVSGVMRQDFEGKCSKVARLVWSQQQDDLAVIELVQCCVNTATLLPVSGLAEMFVAIAFLGRFVT